MLYWREPSGTQHRIPVGCSRCDGEWGKCEHSKQRHKTNKRLEDIRTFISGFGVGCILGLIIWGVTH